MRPIKLKFEGIRSFSESVEINFEEVSQNGLFGIFGPTGSGKSTILDSIIIALYGKVGGDRDMGELVSTRKKNAFVSLEFEITERGNRKRYLVERSFKLKKDLSYSGATASLYETTNGQAVVTASLTGEVNKKIEEIIGLGREEFTKCIILPQGKFSEFVKATKAERVKIIEKLFALERFSEFSVRLKNKIAKLNVEIAERSGELHPYEDVTKERLDEELKLLESAQSELDILNVKQSKNEDYLSENQSVYVLYGKMSEEKKALEELTRKKCEIDRLCEVVELYDEAEKILNASETFEKIKAELTLCEAELSQREQEFSKLEERFKAAEKQFLELASLANKKTQAILKKQQLEQLRESVAKRNELELAVERGSAKIERDSVMKQKMESDLKATKLQLCEIADEIELFKSKCDVSKAFACVVNSTLDKEYNGQIDYYKALECRLKIYADGSELYGFIKEENESRKLHYESLLDGLANDNESVEDAIRAYEIAAANLEKLKKQQSRLKVDEEKLKGEISLISQRIDNASNELEKAQSERDDIIVKLSKICDDINNFEMELHLAVTLVSQIEREEVKIKDEYVSAKDECENGRRDLIKSRTDCELKRAQTKAEESILSGAFTQRVATVDAARAIIGGDEDKARAVQKIERYKSDFEYYTKSVAKIQAEIEKSGFNPSEYSEALEKRAEFIRLRENLTKNLEKYKNNSQILSQNFDKRCIIEKELNKIRARANVFSRLEQAVKGRAFSEFIAAEFLDDVAKEARKTLLELTGGKYDVIYRDSIDSGKDGFFILDNLNGGVERSVASLSGGETFLVSLSLALALSVSIYAGSDKPMEFFFLDEGFGTLDEELVDTVLDSLEKLRNKNFSIGLISHLAEMKSRIDSKIIVTPASEVKGSSVKVVR